MKHLGDITKINGAEIEPVDVITGGSPCQDLSIAGKRAGLAGARSGLFMEQIRIVKEMREHDRAHGRTGDMVRPRYMVWENVPGAFSSVEHMVARRLTPLECERLQGYPDGWTDIGEWCDSKGKFHKDADSPRYKACGNSIALPFWSFLAKRISAQYLRPVTMGSLFDGIGGFPLVFERCNGKGTARWASEIEEFPIAVTKLRFGEE